MTVTHRVRSGWLAVACLSVLIPASDACAESLVGSIYRAWPESGRPIDDGSINRTTSNPPGWRQRHGGDAQASETVCFRARLVRGEAGRRVRFSILPAAIGSITVTRQAGLSCGSSQTATTRDGAGRSFVDCVTTGAANPRNALFCVKPPGTLVGGRFRAGFSIPDSDARYTVIDVGVKPRVVATPAPAPPTPAVAPTLGACVRFGDLAQSHDEYEGVYVVTGGSAMWRAGQRYYTFGGSQTPSANTYSRSSWIQRGNTWERTDCNPRLQAVRKTTLYLTKRAGNAPNPAREVLSAGSFAGFGGLRYYLEVRGSPTERGSPRSGIIIGE